MRKFLFKKSNSHFKTLAVSIFACLFSISEFKLAMYVLLFGIGIELIFGEEDE